MHHNADVRLTDGDGRTPLHKVGVASTRMIASYPGLLRLLSKSNKSLCTR